MFYEVKKIKIKKSFIHIEMKNHSVPVAIMKVRGIILYDFDNVGLDKRISLISPHRGRSVVT